MTISDVIMVFATLLSPVIALGVLALVARKRATTDRRVEIFRTLMRTRAQATSTEYVDALNAIDVEFQGSSRRLRDILAAWHQYQNWMDQPVTQPAWEVERRRLLTDLLFQMSEYLGYNIDRAIIGKLGYSPVVHGNKENDETTIRRELAKILSGQTSLPIFFTNQLPAASANAGREASATTETLPDSGVAKP